MSSKEPPLQCTMCRKEPPEVLLVAGIDGFICNECTLAVMDVWKRENRKIWKIIMRNTKRR